MKRLALLLLLAACNHDQSHREAWQTICDAPNHVASKNPSDVWVWIDKHLTNAEAREDIAALGSQEGDHEPDIRGILTELRIDPNRCALLND